MIKRGNTSRQLRGSRRRETIIDPADQKKTRSGSTSANTPNYANNKIRASKQGGDLSAREKVKKARTGAAKSGLSSRIKSGLSSRMTTRKRRSL